MTWLKYLGPKYRDRAIRIAPAAGMVSADPDETLTAQVVEYRGADYFI